MNVIPEGFFGDVLDPTDEELTDWAYTDGAMCPPEMSQDWDICIMNPNRMDLFLKLASDASCPNRRFFIRCLYLMVGDAVRTRGITWRPIEAQAWIAGVPAVVRPQDVAEFFSKATDLLTGRTKYHDRWPSGPDEKPKT